MATKTKQKTHSSPNVVLTKEKINEIVKKNWPKAKKDLEKLAQETKKLIHEGEKHVVQLTDKSVRQLKILTLTQRKKALLGAGR